MAVRGLDPVGAVRRLPNEVRLFAGISTYGLVLATIYWFVSYEIAGTVLLGGFGLATGAAFVLLRRGESGRPGLPAGAPPGPLPDGPFGDESGAVPLRSLAPLELGFGLAVVGLGLVFGIWFVIAGLLPVVIGAADWLGGARAEYDLVVRLEGELLDSAAHGDDREE